MRRCGPAIARACLAAAVSAAATIQSAPAGAQMATADRLEAPGWWPTKSAVERTDYAGAAACADCHPSYARQAATSMALTASRARDASILDARPEWTFAQGDTRYTIDTRDGRRRYAVRRGAQSLEVDLGWALGAGSVGQTYLYEKDGVFHESRISYFDALQAFDVTPARGGRAAATLEEALGRPLKPAEALRCLGCHTTATAPAGALDAAGLTPGIRCEACHGPGRIHVASARGGEPEPAGIFDPSRLSPADAVDFCGACHATFWDVKLADEKGIAALRSQPYRLQSSRCWGKGDRRLTCVACHDPHRPLERDPSAYDARCTSCHVAANSTPTAERPGRPCPTAQEGCVSCHMPKYEVPEMHHDFTDHLIRVVRSGR